MSALEGDIVVLGAAGAPANNCCRRLRKETCRFGRWFRTAERACQNIKAGTAIVADLHGMIWPMRRHRALFMLLAALCRRHSSADFTNCMCEFNFRQAQVRLGTAAVRTAFAAPHHVGACGAGILMQCS